MEAVTLSVEADADLAPLLEAKAELEGNAPTETPAAASQEQQEQASKDAQEVTETPTQDEPTDEAAKPVEDKPAPGPDLSWLPEDERAAFVGLPDGAKQTLMRIRKDALKGMTKAQQEAAALKKDAEFARNLGSAEERAAYLEWRRGRAADAGKAKADDTPKPKSRLEEILGDPELVSALREEFGAIGREKAREVISEPEIRVQAVDDALLSARGEDVTDEEFSAAAKEIAATFNGRPYDFVTPDTAAHYLGLALRAVRAGQAAAAKVTPSSPPAPRAAVIQGKSTGKPTKPIPRWVAEKRDPTDAEIWAEALEDFGLDRARAAQLVKNGYTTVRGTP